MTSNLDSQRDRIVFLGTGPVSLVALQHLAKSYDIEAVITKPAPDGHGSSRVTSPVRDWAREQGLTVYEPSKKNELAGLVTPGRFASRLGVVVDYGLIIPDSVLDAFELGIINSHFSLLPRWRGADPITFAVLSGDKVSGVSLMRIVAAMDEGPLLAQAELEVAGDITTPQLTEQLCTLSNTLLDKTLPGYIAGELQPYEQTTEGVTYSRKLTKDDGRLDSAKSVEVLEREVRAFADWPSSYFAYDGLTIKVITAATNSTPVPTGELRRAGKQLLLGCKGGSLEVLQLQLPGKKPIQAADFINSHPKLKTI